MSCVFVFLFRLPGHCWSLAGSLCQFTLLQEWSPCPNTWGKDSEDRGFRYTCQCCPSFYIYSPRYRYVFCRNTNHGFYLEHIIFRGREWSSTCMNKHFTPLFVLNYYCTLDQCLLQIIAYVNAHLIEGSGIFLLYSEIICKNLIATLCFCFTYLTHLLDL